MKSQFLINSMLKSEIEKKLIIKNNSSQLTLTYQTCNQDHETKNNPIEKKMKQSMNIDSYSTQY
jgi:hypothetical protein